MAKRQRPPEAVIADWAAADETLRAVGECRQALARIEAETAGAVDQAKAAGKEKAAPYAKRLAVGEAALEAFTKAHEADLDGRSKRLTHGVVGFRKSTKLVLKRTVEFVVGALRARKIAGCIRVKEEVDKEALDHYDDETLAAVGCARKTTDEFYAETPGVTL